MKYKLIAFIISFFMVFSICACDDSNSINVSNDSNVISSSYQSDSTSQKQECSHSWVSATCTEPKTCNICGETSGAALGHTTQTGICTRCNQNFGKWIKKYYVDEFGLPTKTPYITNTEYIVGTFSNSATTNSKLYAYFLIDAEDIAIVLLEYGSHKVKSYSTDDYSIIMLDTKNIKHNMYGTMYKNGDRVFINDSYKTTVLNALKKSGSVSFYLECSETIKSTYLFTVDTSNFSEIYYTL